MEEELDELANRWKGKASVFVVYTREAHPRGGAGNPYLFRNLDVDGRAMFTIPDCPVFRNPWIDAELVFLFRFPDWFISKYPWRC